jgi:type IV pilus assembly protein PilC
MQLFTQLPLSGLIEFCRALRHNLDAGLTLRHVFRQQGERGPFAVRPVARRMAEKLDEGESLEKALKDERAYFPAIFISLVAVGEQTGSLPEVFAELEKYFVLQQRLRRQFIQQITWPALQLVAAIFVIAGMIFLLAALSPSGKPSWDPLGLGFTGERGALRFLITAFGSLAAIIAGYFIVTRAMKQKAVVDAILLRLWIIGPCVSAIALLRFCVALRLTMETSLGITKGVRLSMRATGNAAFDVKADVVCDALKQGEDLSAALNQSRVFPCDFINILGNAEEGGRVPEVMRHQAEYYDEEARRRLTILTQAASWGVYAVVAGLIIFVIFRIFTSYISLLDSYAK